VVGADEEVVSPKIGPPVAHCMNQADQLPLVGCQLEVASGEGSAEEGEGSDVLMKDRAKPRARRITVSHHFAERMRLEIVPLFALGDQHRVKELLDLGVSGFGFAQDFAHKVHRSLYFQSMPFFLPFYN